MDASGRSRSCRTISRPIPRDAPETSETCGERGTSGSGEKGSGEEEEEEEEEGASAAA
jgi:hypothetical protein